MDDGSVLQAEAFVEKPDAETAARYCAEGYLWNAGNFIFRADVMQAELRQHAPLVLDAAAEALGKARKDLEFLLLDKGRLLAGAENFDRLCSDGTYRQGRRRAGGYRLVGCRHLGGGR